MSADAWALLCAVLAVIIFLAGRIYHEVLSRRYREECRQRYPEGGLG